jgi:hypothetical protein
MHAQDMFSRVERREMPNEIKANRIINGRTKMVSSSDLVKLQPFKMRVPYKVSERRE